MKRQRAKLASDSRRAFHYNTRSSNRHGSIGISDSDRAEICDAFVEKSASLRVTRRRKEISDDRRTNSDLLPVDLVMEILKRLPVKTLTRFLCISKLWASIIRLPYFMKLFLAESSNRPERLFLTFMRGQDCLFFTSLEALNPGEASLATYHKPRPRYDQTISSSSVHGLVCYTTARASRLVVYNSSTRKSIMLPKFEQKSFVTEHFLGYDPVDGVYKVLCMTRPWLGSQTAEPDRVFQVLTLGNGSSWKMIENSHTHYPMEICISQICINGVLYYEAYAEMVPKETAVRVMMSFDVRSEKFNLIKRPSGALSPDDSYSRLIRYEGKLAIISWIISAYGSIVFWVLEDALKHKWSMKVLVLPNSWKSLAQGTSPDMFHRFVNVTDAGELILAPVFMPGPVPPYYVIYYDPKRNSLRKVEIQGIKEHKLSRRNSNNWFLAYLLSSQVESLMFL